MCWGRASSSLRWQLTLQQPTQRQTHSFAAFTGSCDQSVSIDCFFPPRLLLLPHKKTNWKQILLDLLSFWLTHISSPSFRYFSLSLHCLSLLARSALPLTAQRRWFLMTTLFNWGVLYFLSVTPDSHSPHMHTLPHMHTAAASLCITSSFFSFLGCYILTLGKLIDF